MHIKHLLHQCLEFLNLHSNTSQQFVTHYVFSILQHQPLIKLGKHHVNMCHRTVKLFASCSIHKRPKNGNILYSTSKNFPSRIRNGQLFVYGPSMSEDSSSFYKFTINAGVRFLFESQKAARCTQKNCLLQHVATLSDRTNANIHSFVTFDIPRLKLCKRFNRKQKTRSSSLEHIYLVRSCHYPKRPIKVMTKPPSLTPHVLHSLFLRQALGIFPPPVSLLLSV